MSTQPRQRRQSILKSSYTNSSPNTFERSKLIHPNCPAPVSIYRPSQTKGVFVVRPLPARDDTPGTFLDYRYSTDDFDMSDWIRCCTTANYVGVDKRETFVLFDPRDGSYDINSNPYQILQSKLFAGKKSGDSRLDLSDLNKRLESKMDNPLSRPARSAFFFAGVYQANTKNVFVGPGKLAKGLGPEDQSTMVHISGTAVDNLFKILNERTEAYKNVVSEDPAVIAKAMVAGDPVRLKHGRFLVFCDPDEELALLPEGVQQRPAPPRLANAQAKPYHVEVLKEIRLRGNRKASLEGHESLVWQRALPFDSVLHFPSHDEICFIVAQLFQSKRDWLEYAWADHPDFFTSEVKGVLYGRTSSTSGAGGGMSKVGGIAPPMDDEEDVLDEEDELADGEEELDEDEDLVAAATAANHGDDEDEDEDDLDDDDDVDLELAAAAAKKAKEQDDEDEDEDDDDLASELDGDEADDLDDLALDPEEDEEETPPEPPKPVKAKKLPAPAATATKPTKAAKTARRK